MKRKPDLNAMKAYTDIVSDSVTVVPIKGTKKSVKIRWIKPYTIERLTQVWLERDLASAKVENGSDVLKDLAKEPYFAFKEAALIILNNDLRIRLFFGLYWRHLARKYSEHQITDIIAEGKKKLPLMPHFETMAYSTDMRMDWMKMTTKEAEQYRAELLSEANLLSSKTSRNTGGRDGGYSDGNGTSATVAS